MDISPAQLKAVHALLNKAGLLEEKAGLVEQATGGRTTSSRRMTAAEAGRLISHLGGRLAAGPAPDAAGRMKRKILSMAHQMGWRLEGGKVDMAHINAWCRKHGHAHKPLDAHTPAELPRLVTQFEQVYESYLGGL